MALAGAFGSSFVADALYLQPVKKLLKKPLKKTEGHPAHGVVDLHVIGDSRCITRVAIRK